MRSRRSRLRVLASMALLAVIIMVCVLVWLRSPVVVSPEGYLSSAEGSSVTVLLTTGSGDVVVGASARETPDTVDVVVEVRSPRGSRTAVGIPVDVLIPLERPLGGRTVIDGRTGSILPEVEQQP